MGKQAASAKGPGAAAAAPANPKSGKTPAKAPPAKKQEVPAEKSAKAAKAAKRAEKEAAEAARLAERDAMMLPSCSEGETSESADEGRPAVDASAHAGTNSRPRDSGSTRHTAAAGDAKQSARAAAIAERERVKAEAEARAIRMEAAKAAKDEPTKGGGRGGGRGQASGGGGYPKSTEVSDAAAGRVAGRSSPVSPPDAGADENSDEGEVEGTSARGSKAAAALEKVLAKVAKGEKLSNKERRLHQKHLEKEEERAREEETQLAQAEEPPEIQRWLAEVEEFSLSVSGHGEDADGHATGAAGDAVSVEQFSLAAPGNELLKDASLRLAKGHRYGLLGPNGMGKTTLLKHLVTRKLPIPASWTVALVSQEAAATDRSVVEEVLTANVERTRLAREECQLLEQIEAGSTDDMDADALAKMCERLSAVGAELEASGADAAESQVRQILIGLQFTEKMMEGSVRLLSGGWRMRVSLAKALYLAPDLLLLDEPTNHLDLDAVLWLDDFLSNHFKKTLLVVSHDADFLDSVCTNIVHLEDQQLFQYRGGYTMFKKMHAQRLQEREKDFKKLVTEGKKGAGNKTKKPDKEEIEKARPPKQYTVKFNFLPLAAGANDEGISVHDMCFSYAGKKPWLLGPKLSFRIDTATRVVVVGPNGAGKSTLLNLLSKTVWPDEGEVCHTRRLSVGRYSQHFEELGQKDSLSPVELLMDPEVRRFGAGIENKEQAHRSLGQFGLPNHAHLRPIRELSGGQKARVQFALLTCRRPEVLILDEPTNHLDIESVEEIIAALKRYEGGFVLVSHDARLITSTQAVLWEVDGSGSVRPIGEGNKGFDDYRRKLLLKLEKKRQQEAERARHLAEQRRRRREQAIALRARRT